MGDSQLRRCPYCQQSWPRGPGHDLRGFGWLDPLPRHITPSNGDVLIHDGAHGRNRFLLLETKMPWEKEIRAGQSMLLRAFAGQPNTTVRLLQGTTGSVQLYTVNGDGLGAPIETSAIAVRTSVVDWIDGDRWQDPPSHRTPHRLEGTSSGTDITGGHVCGWQRLGESVYVEGVGEVPIFYCAGCDTHFDWTPGMAAEYLASRRALGR